MYCGPIKDIKHQNSMKLLKTYNLKALNYVTWVVNYSYRKVTNSYSKTGYIKNMGFISNILSMTENKYTGV